MPLSAFSSEQLRQLIKSTSVVTWTADARGEAVDIPLWTELTGQNAEEARGDGWLKVVHPDDFDRVSAAWKSAVAHRQPLNTDYRIRCADGIYRWFNAHGAPVLSSDGNFDRWAGMCLEVPGQWRFGEGTIDMSNEGGATSPCLGADVVRAARAMLDWSAADLAEKSGVSVSTIRRLEDGAKDCQTRQTSTNKLKSAFREAGLAFLVSAGTITGVRWA